MAEENQNQNQNESAGQAPSLSPPGKVGDNIAAQAKAIFARRKDIKELYYADCLYFESKTPALRRANAKGLKIETVKR